MSALDPRHKPRYSATPPQGTDSQDTRLLSDCISAYAKAAADGTRILDLSNLRLKSLPPQILEFPQFQELWLRGNDLSSLPPEIERLKELRTLILSDNKLQSLPPEIGQLTQLKELYLDGNELVKLPIEIGQLRHLTVISLVNNHALGYPPKRVVHQGSEAVIRFMRTAWKARK